MSKSLSKPNASDQQQKTTVPCPLPTAPYDEMSSDAQREYIELLTAHVSDYCDSVGC